MNTTSVDTIRYFILNKLKENGLVVDDYLVINIPKHILYVLRGSIPLSLNPEKDLVNRLCEDTLSLYFGRLPKLCVMNFALNKDGSKIKECICDTITEFYPSKILREKSDFYYRVQELLENELKGLKEDDLKYYLEEIPFYIEKAFEKGITTNYYIMDLFFQEHPPLNDNKMIIYESITNVVEKVK